MTKEVFEALRLAIIRGELVPGRLYSVVELAETFGLSRTPVREALIELASRGMIRFERNRGLRVLSTSAHDVEEIFELRLLLEVPATRKAVRQMRPTDIKELRRILDKMKKLADKGAESEFRVNDRLFHRTLLEVAGNRRLVDYIESLRDLVITRGAVTAGRSHSLHDLLDEHGKIMTHVENRDAEASARAMRAHLRHTADLLIEQAREAEEPET